MLGAGGLMFFRFSLLATIILIPQTLSIHGFEAGSGWPSRDLDSHSSTTHRLSRWPVAPAQSGFAFSPCYGLSSCIAFASLMNAELTSAWSAQNFYRTELLMGVGQSFAFLGLVSTLVLQGVFSGDS